MNIEDTIVLLGGLSILILVLSVAAGVGDAIIQWRDKRAQRRRDRVLYYLRKMK